jgi:hypothetical protein
MATLSVHSLSMQLNLSVKRLSGVTETQET